MSTLLLVNIATELSHWQVFDVTKTSLLAGVGFALAMNWGQTGYSLHDLHVESCRTSFGAPLLDMMNHLELLPPHLRCIQPPGFHLRPGARMPTHRYTR